MNMTNPFEHDPDRREIWHILVEEDIEGFVAADFSRCRERFDEARFVGYDARKSRCPDDWAVGFATLDEYAKLWLDVARQFQQARLADGRDMKTFWHELTDLSQIEIKGDHAIAHKKFNGRALTGQGTMLECFWQTLYLLRKIAGAWKITGFVGFLPYDMPPASARSPGPVKQAPPQSQPPPTGAPYSPVLVVAPGRLVAISGQRPVDPTTGQIVGATVEEHTRAALENCRTQLAAAGATFADVFQVRAYLADANEWSRFNAVYKEYLPAPYPTRTVVQAVLRDGIRVEIEMLAMLPG